MSSIEYLKARLDIVDSVIFGGSETKLGGIKDRLDLLSIAVTNVENEIPQVTQSRELIQKMAPQLSAARASLAHTIEKVESILALKAELEISISDLNEVESLSKSVFLSMGVDVSEYNAALEKIEQSLPTLIAETRRQSDEIDQFLEVYESSMQLLANISSTWEHKLTHLEQL